MTTETRDATAAPEALTPTEVKYRNWLAQKLRTDDFWFGLQEKMFAVFDEAVNEADDLPEGLEEFDCGTTGVDEHGVLYEAVLERLQTLVVASK